MAILSEQIYKLITQELKEIGIRFYSDRIPTNCAYPFVMFEITELQNTPDTGFVEDYESYKIRFNIYDNSVNPANIFIIAKQIEELFNTRDELEFLTTDAGFHLICHHKTNDNLTYLNQDNFWKGVEDYIFSCQRNQGEYVD